MAFKFRLEQVLEYRKQLEEQAMQAFGKAQSDRDIAKRHLEELHRELLEQSARLAQSSGLTSAERWLVVSYASALQSDIKICQTHLVILENEVVLCREELVQKAQERKLLETLKEKQLERAKKEEQHKEQQMYDETATLRFRPGVI